MKGIEQSPGKNTTAVILAVDDRPDNLYVIQLLIEEQLPHAMVLSTTDPEEGLAIAQEHLPDVILLDLKMPGMSGIDMCKRLKADEKTSYIPVILITAADTTTELRVEGLEAGAEDFITKPIDNIELAARMKAMLRVKKAEDERRQINENLEKMVREKSAALVESEKQFRTLTSMSPSGIYLSDANGDCLYVNERWCKMAGLTADEAGGTGWIRGIYPEDREKIKQSWYNMVSSKGNWEKEYRFQDKKGKITWVYGVAVPSYDADGVVNGYIGTNVDISERKRAEEKIRASLNEKELLLKEIHHRIKNNMTVISGLLKLQSQSFEDPHVIRAFSESKQRIRSMALVHEKLYNARDLSQIDFSNYIPDLVNQISQTNGLQREKISLNIQANNISMGIDSAVPCGLIINELVTNAFKYAFPGKRQGEISITLSHSNNDYSLEVSDNGAGLPLNIDFQNISSFGLYLVNLLTQQLKGTVEIDRSKGTSIKITFPKDV
jgi:PAS domain S-box-containing protein